MKWITILVFAAAAAAQERTYIMSSNARTFEFEGKVVAGAPYSAQAVTETTQVLADGNRITRKSSSLVARDSQGRTRREMNLTTVGPWSSPENNSGVVFITDPVAGARYTLQTNSKTAVKLPMNAESQQARRELESKLKQAARSREEAERNGSGAGVAAATAGGPVTLSVTVSDGGEMHLQSGPASSSGSNEPKTAATTESLGTRTFEGVVAEGKRVTETIPAGKIGNEKPIEVVNETWYSPELQTVVMSRHSDPRSGEVVYTLTNLSRAEPDPSMFTVPQDYKVREEGRVELRRQP